MKIFLLAFILLNLATFFMFGLDKKKARQHAYRIPEKTLLTLAFFSGGIGSFLGRHMFHHKTRKWYFSLMDLLGFLVFLGLSYWLTFRSHL